MSYKICVIGGKALIFPFMQFGFATYAPESEDALREYLKEIIADNYGVIYIEDAYCHMVSDVLEKYRRSLTPAIIPIGEAAAGGGAVAGGITAEGVGGGTTGGSYADAALRDMVEKAIGINVL